MTGDEDETETRKREDEKTRNERQETRDVIVGSGSLGVGVRTWQTTGFAEVQICSTTATGGHGTTKEKESFVVEKRGRAVEESKGSWSKGGVERQPPRGQGDLHGGVCFDVDENGEECRGSC